MSYITPLLVSCRFVIESLYKLKAFNRVIMLDEEKVLFG